MTWQFGKIDCCQVMESQLLSVKAFPVRSSLYPLLRNLVLFLVVGIACVSFQLNKIFGEETSITSCNLFVSHRYDNLFNSKKRIGFCLLFDAIINKKSATITNIELTGTNMPTTITTGARKFLLNTVIEKSIDLPEGVALPPAIYHVDASPILDIENPTLNNNVAFVPWTIIQSENGFIEFDVIKTVIITCDLKVACHRLNVVDLALLSRIADCYRPVPSKICHVVQGKTIIDILSKTEYKITLAKNGTSITSEKIKVENGRKVQPLLGKPKGSDGFVIETTWISD
jgi:hypothetical protein